MMKKIILTVAMAALPIFAQVKENVEVPYMPFPIKMGEGFDAVQANCLSCHSFGYVLNQGRQSKEFWHKKVLKIIVHFKAPITHKDVKTVTEYLYKHYGNAKLK